MWCPLCTWVAVVILKLIHGSPPNSAEGSCLVAPEPMQALPGLVVTHTIQTHRIASAGDEPLELLTYQLWMVGYWPTVAMTGNGELGFDSGEGA